MAEQPTTTDSLGRALARFWSTYGTAVIIAALIGAAATVVVAIKPWDKKPTGHMVSPQPRDRLTRQFSVSGTLANIPDDRHVWVAVQIGNLMYPKEPEIPRGDTHFLQQIVEGGSPPGGTFSLVLFMVGPEGQRAITSWLESGRRGQGLPGLARIPGSVRLDAVSDLTLG